MASTLDIAPGLGHGLVAAQGLPGGYDAIDDRRMWSLGRQEGAVQSDAYKVSQNASGANLSVDVATDKGYYLVQGDDVLWQGLYLVPATALKANLTLASPPDPALPRVDQIVLEARDDAHRHDGITRARLYVLSGTPTSGANLTNLSGAAPLPASTARLAYVLVGANATQIVAANISDQRPWALAPTRLFASGGSTGTVSTTAVGSWAAWTGGPSITIPESGIWDIETNPILVQQQAASGIVEGRFGISVDGANPTAFADIVTNFQFAASTMVARLPKVTLNAGQVVSLRYATSNAGYSFGGAGSNLIATRVG